MLRVKRSGLQQQSRGQQGFTIIELLLFLAITGLLFLIGFIGTGQQIANVRFADAMRNVHSQLQKQYTQVATGVNPRDAATQCSDPGNMGLQPTFVAGPAVPGVTAGEDEGCLLLGKLVKFDPNTSSVTSYFIVGQRLQPNELTGDDFTDLQNSGPTLTTLSQENFAINWGATFYQPSNVAIGEQTQSFAYVRSPSNGRILTFVFGQDAVNNATSPDNDDTFPDLLTTDNVAKDAGFCFRDNQGRKGLVKVGYEQRTEAIDLALDDFDEQTSCVRSKP